MNRHNLYNGAKFRSYETYLLQFSC